MPAMPQGSAQQLVGAHTRRGPAPGGQEQWARLEWHQAQAVHGAPPHAVELRRPQWRAAPCPTPAPHPPTPPRGAPCSPLMETAHATRAHTARWRLPAGRLPPGSIRAESASPHPGTARAGSRPPHPGASPARTKGQGKWGAGSFLIGVTLGHGIPGKQGQLGQIGVYSGSACVQRERWWLGDSVQVGNQCGRRAPSDLHQELTDGARTRRLKSRTTKCPPSQRTTRCQVAPSSPSAYIVANVL